MVLGIPILKHIRILGAICHGLLKKLHAPAEDRTGDLSILRRALYHIAIKASLYRKAVQVYYNLTYTLWQMIRAWLIHCHATWDKQKFVVRANSFLYEETTFRKGFMPQGSKRSSQKLFTFV